MINLIVTFQHILSLSKIITVCVLQSILREKYKESKNIKTHQL